MGGCVSRPYKKSRSRKFFFCSGRWQRRVSSSAPVRPVEQLTDGIVAPICQEETWFDSMSILGSDSDDDFSSVYGDSLSLGNASDQCPDSTTIQYENAPHFSDGKSGYNNGLHEAHLISDGTENEKFFIRNGYKDSKGSSFFNKSTLDNDLSCLTTVIVLSMNQKPSDGDEKTEICESKRLLFRPRAGLLIPRSMNDKPTPGS
ncbi:hypothetical protein Ccrd_000169 [Cynara cardunculus var. scolymus]|uniref:Uncharacterized protein n=2 Tax=Cynara cardunculus var. scolymus TaxID=59895 RepID=A0A124SDQ7_CYNCS|nr:hypothetical protein Ccrd_000169 [Cynara cardunculus var. scolymus]